MPLDIFQQCYLLSFYSNSVGRIRGTESSLQGKMENALKNWDKDLSDWKVTYGPRVYKDPLYRHLPTSGPQNVWFCAMNADQTYCVVSIAGSSIKNIMDWKEENFAVKQVIDFKNWANTWPQGIKNGTIASLPLNPSVGYVAKGTCSGVQILASNKPPKTAANPNILLHEYLQNQVPVGCKIVFSGHSLGGALAPTLAMGYIESGLINKHPKQNILLLPSAGVSPGNVQFYKDFTGTFPVISGGASKSYQVWNTDYYNITDVVPQAWNIIPEAASRNLQEIKRLYPENKEIGRIVNYGIEAVEKSKCKYFPLEGTSFRWKDPDPKPKTDTELISKRHIEAYWEELGILNKMKKFVEHLMAAGFDDTDDESAAVGEDIDVGDLHNPTPELKEKIKATLERFLKENEIPPENGESYGPELDALFDGNNDTI